MLQNTLNREWENFYTKWIYVKYGSYLYCSTKYKNVWVYYPSKQMCLLLETLPKDAHTWLVVRGPCDMDKVAFIKEDQLCFQQCLLFTALPELRTHNTIYY